MSGGGLHWTVAGSGPALVLLHGFAGDQRSWDGVAAALEDRFLLLRPDLPGHGRSPAPQGGAAGSGALEALLDDLLSILDARGVERAVVVGYSFGGRVALRLALGAPERVAALILESASAGIEDPAERQVRRREDEAWAGRLEQEGIESFVRRWEAQPLFASQARLPPEVRDRQRSLRLAQPAAGLAACLRALGAGAMEPVWERLGSLAMPVLVVAGELDGRYLALGRRLAELAPAAELAVVPGAGHNVHLEAPKAFVETIVGWLDRVAKVSPSFEIGIVSPI